MALNMNREIVTDPLDREDLWADLRENIALLTAHGYTQALVFFGVAWGEHIYGEKWCDLPMPLADLEPRILEAETKGWGRLGDDNLYFTVEELPLRLTYSYESDIHLSYAGDHEIVSLIRERWRTQQWLTEYLKSDTYGR